MIKAFCVVRLVNWGVFEKYYNGPNPYNFPFISYIILRLFFNKETVQKLYKDNEELWACARRNSDWKSDYQ